MVPNYLGEIATSIRGRLRNPRLYFWLDDYLRAIYPCCDITYVDNENPCYAPEISFYYVGARRRKRTTILADDIGPDTEVMKRLLPEIAILFVMNTEIGKAKHTRIGDNVSSFVLCGLSKLDYFFDVRFLSNRQQESHIPQKTSIIRRRKKHIVDVLGQVFREHTYEDFVELAREKSRANLGRKTVTIYSPSTLNVNDIRKRKISAAMTSLHGAMTDGERAARNEKISRSLKADYDSRGRGEIEKRNKKISLTMLRTAKDKQLDDCQLQELKRMHEGGESYRKLAQYALTEWGIVVSHTNVMNHLAAFAEKEAGAR